MTDEEEEALYKAKSKEVSTLILALLIKDIKYTPLNMIEDETTEIVISSYICGCANSMISMLNAYEKAVALDIYKGVMEYLNKEFKYKEDK